MDNKKSINSRLCYFFVSLLAWTSIGWIDPLADKVREGNQLYNDGKYDEALDKYVDARINFPNMPQLDFNMADAQYKRGKYNEAAQLFEKVIKSDDREMKAKSSFNMGNTLYRQGRMKEALEYYKKTVDFIDEAEPESGNALDVLRNDAKYNYEYVEKKMREQEQKQQSQDQKDQQQEKDQNKKDDKQSDGNKGEDKDKQESKEEKQQPRSENTQEKGEDKKDENSRQSDQEKQKERPMEQQRQPQPQGQKQMSKEEAERLLEALNHSEKEARTIMRDTQRLQHKSVEKDW